MNIRLIVHGIIVGLFIFFIIHAVPNDKFTPTYQVTKLERCEFPEVR